MTDYLGPLTLGTSGTYTLLEWAPKAAEGGLEADVTVQVSAASADALLAAVEALAAQLYQGNSYAHTVPGATYPVAYVVRSVTSLTYDEYGGVLAFWMRVSFTLSLVGQPRGAFTTLYSAHHVDAPASESLAALLGTHPTALDVTIDDDAGGDLHSVWCALAPTALADGYVSGAQGHASWLVLASDLTWTTMSTTTGATMWGNTARYTTSSSYQTASLDTQFYPAGKYRLCVRASQEAGTGYVMDSQNAEAVPITRTSQHITVVGDLDLPVADTSFGSPANLTLSVKSDGTNDCIVNAFLLLPLDLGFFSWHHDTVTTEIDQLDVGPSGIYMWSTGTTDGAADMTYFRGGVLMPKVLAAHVGTLIATASPTGSDWPSDWDKTSSGVSADTGRFKCIGASKYAWYAATNAATPLIAPGAWYELSFTRDVDSWVAGAATAEIVWQDIDGNTIATNIYSTTGANDASPTSITCYAKAPAQAARARVQVGTNASGNMTVYFSAVVLRRCPLRLIIACENSGGTLTSYLHPVHLTVSYVPRYEVAR